MMAIAVDQRPARADLAGKAASLGAVVCAVAGVALVLSSPTFFFLTTLALVAGVVVGELLPDRSLFDSISGIGAAGLLFVGGVLLWAAAAYATHIGPPPPQILLLLVFVAGLDWDRVLRLRVRVVLSGAWLVPALALVDDAGDAIPLGLLWFGVALTALWVLQRDGQGVVPRPATMATVGGNPSRLQPGEFFGVAGVSAVVALVLAILLGAPSCSLFDRPQPDLPGNLEGQLGDAINPGEPTSGFPNSDANGSPSGPGAGGGGTGEGQPGDAGEYSGREPFYDGTEAYQYDPESGMYYRDPSGDYGFKDPNGDTWVPAENGKPLPPGAQIGEGQIIGGELVEGEVVEGEFVPDEPEKDDESTLAKVLGVLAAVVVIAALAALGYFLWRRWGGASVAPAGSGARPWGEEAARRLEVEGVRRGRNRAIDESVARYAEGLGGDIGEDRLPGVGRVISLALFGRTEPTASERGWVEQVLDELAGQESPVAAVSTA